MSKATLLLPFEEGVLFGKSFLADHAGQLMSDPRLALIELVANSILKRAHSRTFHLLEKVRTAFPDVATDDDVQDLLRDEAQLFD